MKIIVMTLVSAITLWSCQNPPKDEKQISGKGIKDTAIITDNLIKLLWGSSDHSDSNNTLEMAVYYLNKSMYKSALGVLENRFLPEIDTVNTGGFYGFNVSYHFSDDQYEKYNNCVQYCFFRLNDYAENVVGNELENEILGLAKFDDQLYILQSIEDSYVSIKNNINISDADSLITKIKKVKKKIPDAKRLDFILANEYLIVNDSDNALKIFDGLIREDYYALSSLRNVIKYLSINGSPLLNKYVSIFNDKFPHECNLIAVDRLLKSAPENLISSICNKCIQSTFQRDSVYVKAMIAKYFMNLKKLNKVDSIATEYLSDIHNKTFDSTVLYEKGIYCDLKMRVLFLQGKYNELCKFAKHDLALNPLIAIDNEQELKFYIQNLYIEYISIDLKGFLTFFEKNFKDCYQE